MSVCLSVLFLFLVELVNDGLAFLPLHLTLVSPLLYLAMEAFGRKRGMVSVAVCGLVYDTLNFAPFGFNLVLFGIVFTALVTYREQTKAQTRWHQFYMVQIANFVIITVHGIYFYEGIVGNTGNYVLSVFLNILASQVVLVPVLPWFMNLQATTLKKIDHSIEQKGTAS